MTDLIYQTFTWEEFSGWVMLAFAAGLFLGMQIGVWYYTKGPGKPRR